MKRLFLFITLFVLSFTALSAAYDLSYSTNNSLPLKVADLQVDQNSMTISLDVSQPQWKTTNGELDEVDYAEYDLGGKLEVEGYPVVPTVGRFFRIPPRSGISVEILHADYETLTDVDYATFLDESDPDFLCRAVVEHDEWFPGNLVQVSEPTLMHDFRIANLITFPVQVNQARHEVRVYRNIQVKVNFEGTNLHNSLPAWPSKISEAYLPWYRQFADWNDAELDEYTLYRGNVQVIMPVDDPGLDDLFEWKRQKGWVLEFITPADVAAWDRNAIKTELQNRWDAAEEKFDYIMIVGDSDGPYATPAGDGQGDHYYGCLAGNDDLMDVTIGRISVSEAAHLNIYTNKVLTYERDPDLFNTDWYTRGQVSYSSTSSGISPVFLGRYVRYTMLANNFTQVDTAWVSPWGDGNVNNRSITRINDGVSLYFSRGYLGAGLQPGDINSLDNDDMTPVCIDITCGTGSWVGGVGVGINEAYMRAGTANTATGGIGAMGTATAGTNTKFNNGLAGGSVFSMIIMENPAIGDVFYGGKVNIWNNYAGIEDNSLASFNEWYNLMGDPTVWIWTDSPHIMDVEAESEIDLGTNGYEVDVQENGQPLVNAWVTLYKVDENEDVVARGVTDQNGHVTLPTDMAFSGTAKLTVTQKNFAPHRMDVTINSPDSRIGFIDVSYQDDNQNGTVGNGNGIPEAGETVGLSLNLANYGNSTENNITVTASSADPWILSTSGNQNLATLESGMNQIANGLILVEISPEAQNNWNIHLDVTINSDNGNYTGDLPIEISAPHFALVVVNGANDIVPGVERNITIELMNMGRSDAAAGTATLISDETQLIVTQETADIPAIAIEANGTTAEFSVVASINTIPGYVARPKLVINTDSGQVDTLTIPVILGTRESTDPIGPDKYGYYAFENVDIEYDAAPEYNWIEVNSHVEDNDFDGTGLGLEDSGTNRDMAVTIDLPFDVQYYGEIFDQVTVCTNGWIAMGDQADIPLMRNWMIPSPNGPNFMIAPYWDERTFRDNSDVYTFYHEESGRFIIEFFELYDYDGFNPCTFEIVIYDQIVRPTLTGDNEFEFVYDTIEHTMGTTHSGSDNYYWTTGIENGDQTDGLMVAYWLQYTPGSSPIEEGRSILFSTEVAIVSGTMEGTVTDANTGDPIEGIEIRLLESAKYTVTDNLGNYSMDLRTGDYTPYINNYPYAYFQNEVVRIDSAETTVVNFSLGVGIFEAGSDSVYTTITEEEPIVESVWLYNRGSAPIDVILKAIPILETDEYLDVLESRTISTIVLDENLKGLVEVDGSYYIAGSNNFNNPNLIYKVSSDYQFKGALQQPGSEQPNADDVGMLDLTYDGRYLWGSYGSDIIAMDPISGQESRRLPGVYDQHRAIAYDPVLDALWVTDDNRNIVAIDVETGVVVDNIPANMFITSMTYYGADEERFFIYFSAIDEDGTFAIYKANHVSDEIVKIGNLPYEDDGSTLMGIDIYEGFQNNYVAIVGTVENEEAVRLVAWEYDLFVGWALVDPTQLTIPAHDSTEVDISFSGGNLENGLYSGYIRALHNTAEGESHLPVSLVLDRTNAIDENSSLIPTDFALDNPYPNPFNNTTRISFAVPHTSRINLVVYDLLGREVAQLVNQKMDAGKYQAVFNGKNLASGMYFVRMNAGNGFVRTQKMMLLK